MARKYRSYSEEDIKNAVPKVESLSGLLRELGLKSAGGNYANMKRRLQDLDVDTSHWKGHAWNRGNQLKDWSDYTRASRIKPHLIKERGHKCSDCGLDQWKNQPIPLEIHHVDGNRTNNELKNLQLLCCNCHATTKNWRNRKGA